MEVAHKKFGIMSNQLSVDSKGFLDYKYTVYQCPLLVTVSVITLNNS